jgi:hypothetical protein
MGTFWEADQWCKAQEDNQKELIRRYGKAVVIEMAKRTKDYQWDKINYNNSATSRLREEAEGAQPWEKPYLPTYEELAGK